MPATDHASVRRVLACGAGAHNMTTDNITIEHLLNLHRVARRLPNARWSRVRSVALDGGVDAAQILDLYHAND